MTTWDIIRHSSMVLFVRNMCSCWRVRQVRKKGSGQGGWASRARGTWEDGYVRPIVNNYIPCLSGYREEPQRQSGYCSSLIREKARDCVCVSPPQLPDAVRANERR